MIVKLIPSTPGIPSYMSVLGEAEKVEKTNVGSQAFRVQSAKKVLVEHALTVVHYHGLLLESQGCVLMHGANELQRTEPQPGAGSGLSTGGAGAARAARAPPATASPAVDLTGGASSGGGGTQGRGAPAAGSPDEFTNLLKNPRKATEDREEVNADAWIQHLDRRLARVQPVLPPTPLLSQQESFWASAAAPVDTSPPTWAEVMRPYDAEQPHHLPWLTHIWDSGEGGVLFVPGLPRKHISFWREVILVDHPLRDTLLPYLQDGVNLRDFLVDSHRGPSASQPYQPQAFRQAEFKIGFHLASQASSMRRWSLSSHVDASRNGAMSRDPTARIGPTC